MNINICVSANIIEKGIAVLLALKLGCLEWGKRK